jgi:hypothetical protein
MSNDWVLLSMEAEAATQSLISAVDMLKRLAAQNPAVVRPCTFFLASASDELSELVAKLSEQVREAAE